MTYPPKHNPLHQIPMEILSASDYEAAAPQFLADPVFAYLSGGSGHDQTLMENQQAFEKYRIIPRLLNDVSHVSTDSIVLDQPFLHPILLAPVAYQKLAHPKGELETAKAAAATDTCMVCSTLSSVSLQKIAKVTGERKWFQLYFQASREDSLALLRRAESAAYEAIVITLDASIQYPSVKAYRAGFELPSDITAVNLEAFQPTSTPLSPSLDDLEWLLEVSILPIIVKGVLSADDARRLEKMGVAAIVVSNHGGRTLDGVVASLDALPAIREAVSDDFPLILDSGIRSGSDVFKALALGANAVMIGRLQIYALSVAGALGVGHMLKLLREELELYMTMCGCSSLSDIHRSHLHPLPPGENRPC